MMIEDFSFKDVMRLSNIKRWRIIEMSRDQSVAEHSYNVAMISIGISELMDFKNCAQSIIIYWALIHDLPEVVTGDVPTTMKPFIKNGINSMEKTLCPMYTEHKKAIRYCPDAHAIVKAADYIDAIQFAEKFCVDSRKNEIIRDIQKNMDKFLAKKEHIHVAQAVEKLAF